MTQPIQNRVSDWEISGRELGETLRQYSSIVVIGADPVSTGRVAIGLGRAQAVHRRVAVGDLFAESQPIQELVGTDDPHGLVDSFLYGVSLTRIAWPVPDAGQLYVMPSGTEPPTYEEILPNPRWHRLAAGFREVGALLVLAVPASAPEIDKLVAATDGAVLVGDASPDRVPVARIIASLREPPRSAPAPVHGTPISDVHVLPPLKVPFPRQPRPKHEKDHKHRTHLKPPKLQKLQILKLQKLKQIRLSATMIAGIALTVVLTGIAGWLAYRPLADSSGGFTRRPGCDSAGLAAGTCTPGSPAVAMTPDSTAVSIVDSGGFAKLDSTIVPAVSNPADSVQAASFGVELISANTQAGAILKLQKDGTKLPAATFAPALVQGNRWYKVVSGAFNSRAEAESLLAGFQRNNLVQGGEHVVKVPFAFLVDSVPATAVPGMVASYADRGQPVYALRQPNGKAWLLVGAFESLEQASLYMESLRASGIQPALVYRKGRPF
jgi:hypothetical protein